MNGTDDLRDALGSVTDGYNLPGYIVDRMAAAAREWHLATTLRGDTEIRVSRLAPEGGGLGTDSGIEREAVADLWARCAEDGVAPCHRPVVEWTQVWDPRDPARPRLQARECTAWVSARALPPAVVDAEVDGPNG